MSFVVSVKNDLLHQFVLKDLVIQVNGKPAEFVECELTKKYFNKFFTDALYLCFRLVNNSNRKKIWEMGKSYLLQCKYQDFESNVTKLVFNKACCDSDLPRLTN